MENKLCIFKGYNQTDFEIITHKSGNYELPVSQSANYVCNKNININKFVSHIELYGYILISPYTEEDIYLSSKILDCKSNEFLHIKINNNIIQIFPKSEDFSFETFKRIVNCINNNFCNIKFQSKE